MFGIMGNIFISIKCKQKCSCCVHRRQHKRRHRRALRSEDLHRSQQRNREGPSLYNCIGQNCANDLIELEDRFISRAMRKKCSQYLNFLHVEHLSKDSTKSSCVSPYSPQERGDNAFVRLKVTDYKVDCHSNNKI